jgi:hypothetical protein
MTAADWLEFFNSSYANGLTSQVTILTLVSGYLVVAYTVGKKLTSLQVSIANIVYVGGSSTTLWANYQSMVNALYAGAQAARLDPSVADTLGGGGGSTVPAIIVAGINALFVVFSLIFMLQVRRGKID